LSENLPIKYYKRKYGNDTSAAFIHLIREIGQVAFAIETKNAPVLNAKLTEAAALLRRCMPKNCRVLRKLPNNDCTILKKEILLKATLYNMFNRMT
jgi:hypothetical protein